jgi:hypothetical protein
MAITKSNNHELSLDPTKPNEKSGCTLATTLALPTRLLLSPNEVLNLGLENLNHPTRLLLSLALQSISSAEQIGKRASMHEMEGYK